MSRSWNIALLCLFYNDLKVLIHHRMNYFKFNNWPIYLFYILKFLTSFAFILVYMSSWVIYKLICRVRNLANMRWCDLFSIIFLPQCHFLPIFFENKVFFRVSQNWDWCNFMLENITFDFLKMFWGEFHWLSALVKDLDFSGFSA